MYLRTKTVRRNGRTYHYHSVCESIRDGRRVRQSTLAELGRLSPGVASEVAELCAAADGADGSDVRPQGLCAPLLFEALLASTGVDGLLREIGRRNRGPSLEPALRLLIAGRLFGSTSTAETARNAHLLAPPANAEAEISYDLLLRALGALGRARGAVEAWLAEASAGPDRTWITLGADFCSTDSVYPHPLHVEVGLPDLLPLSLCDRSDVPARSRIIALSSDAESADWPARANSKTACCLMDLGHTRTILGRALLERADQAEVRPLACGEARLMTGPDGERHALVRPCHAGEDASEAILQRVRSAERGLAQLQRDVRAGKVRRGDTISDRAERLINEQQAWRWLGFEASDDQFAYTRRADRLRRDLGHAGEHIVRIHGGNGEALEALDAATTLAMLFTRDLSILPVRHRSPHRVAGHFTLCLLAGWLLRTLDLRLGAAGSELCGFKALRLAYDAAALTFDLSSGCVVGRPPLGGDLTDALHAAGVDDPRSAVDGLLSRLADLH